MSRRNEAWLFCAGWASSQRLTGAGLIIPSNPAGTRGQRWTPGGFDSHDNRRG
jgi:hypothetical protein